MSNTSFLSSYHECREAFIQEADTAGFRLLRNRIPAEENSDLFMDFAINRSNPKKWVIHLVGVHGIEGFLGSAIQRSILHTYQAKDVSVLFVHPVNPYGMHYLRRTNAENIDLNRNSLFGAKIENEAYSQFHGLLNPNTGFEKLIGPVMGIYKYIAMGRKKASQIIASGQQQYPKGLFFAGTAEQREIYLLGEFLKAHLSEAEEIMVLDIHTGLGKFGEELIFSDRAEETLAANTFGRSLDRPIAYDTLGPLSGALRRFLPRCKIHYFLQEFGTCSAFKTLMALRAENFAWQWAHDNEFYVQQTKQTLLETFFPTDEKWRNESLKLGIKRFLQAADYLAHTNEANSH